MINLGRDRDRDGTGLNGTDLKQIHAVSTMHGRSRFCFTHIYLFLLSLLLSSLLFLTRRPRRPINAPGRWMIK